MLVLCQNKEALKHLSVYYKPLEMPMQKKYRNMKSFDRSDKLFGGMPIFIGPDQDKPWVKELYRYVHFH